MKNQTQTLYALCEIIELFSGSGGYLTVRVLNYFNTQQMACDAKTVLDKSYLDRYEWLDIQEIECVVLGEYAVPKKWHAKISGGGQTL